MAGPVSSAIGPIVPVITIDDPADAVPLARALLRGGIACAEITLRTDTALDALRAVAERIDGFTVGAGTVLDVADVDAAVDAGAAFVVSPGLDADVVGRAHARGVDAIPGVATATEVQAAKRLGLTRLKLFPADVLGGLALIDRLSGPFPDIRFLPSGGIGPANAAEYARHPGVFAIGGSWMAPRDLIAQGGFDEIERRSREAIALLRGTA